MSASALHTDSLEAVGRVLADHELRLRSLEAKAGPGAGQVTSTVAAPVAISSTAFSTAAGPSVTATTGPSGILLVFLSALVGQSTTSRTASGSALLSVQLTYTDPVTSATVTHTPADEEALQWSEVAASPPAAVRMTRVNSYTGFPPGVAVTVTVARRVTNGSAPYNSNDTTLLVVPL